MTPKTVREQRPGPPPRVAGLPLLGSALSLARAPIEFLLEQYRRLGPIFEIRAGHIRMVVMAGEEANDFLHNAGKHCFSSAEFWRPPLREFEAPNAFVGLDGQPHLILRRHFAPQFSRGAGERRLADLFRITLEAFRAKRPGEEIPFVRFSQTIVSRQVGTILVGQTPSAAEHEAILRYTNAVIVNLSLRRLPRFFLWLRPRFHSDRRTTFGFANRLVREQDREENYIEAVVQAAKRHPELFTAGDVQSSGLIPFFAGIDTVGQTLVFAIYELLRRPELLTRVRAEVDGLFADGPPGKEQLRRATDLTGTAMEALRLYPVALGMPRTAAEDFQFAGCTVRKGQSVLVFTTACHFLPEYFPEPRRFDIDRFRPPRDEHKRPDVFAPFGRGPHVCLGAGLADLQLAATLAAMLHYCDLELAEPRKDFPPILSPSLTLGSNFRVRFNGWRNEPGEVIGSERLEPPA